jgi:sarcosine oxidase subunit beta
MSRHAVFTLEGATPYTRDLPVLKDLASPAKLYMRSYATRQLLVGDGNEGETLAAPDTEQADVPLDHVVELGAQVAHRLPAFADAGLASSWTGVYDVTPDWNPVWDRCRASRASTSRTASRATASSSRRSSAG